MVLTNRADCSLEYHDYFTHRFYPINFVSILIDVSLLFYDDYVYFYILVYVIFFRSNSSYIGSEHKNSILSIKYRLCM